MMPSSTPGNMACREENLGSEGGGGAVVLDIACNGWVLKECRKERVEGGSEPRARLTSRRR